MKTIPHVWIQLLIAYQRQAHALCLRYHAVWTSLFSVSIKAGTNWSKLISGFFFRAIAQKLHGSMMILLCYMMGLTLLEHIAQMWEHSYQVRTKPCSNDEIFLQHGNQIKNGYHSQDEHTYLIQKGPGGTRWKRYFHFVWLQRHMCWIVDHQGTARLIGLSVLLAVILCHRPTVLYVPYLRFSYFDARVC